MRCRRYSSEAYEGDPVALVACGIGEQGCALVIEGNWGLVTESDVKATG